MDFGGKEKLLAVYFNFKLSFLHLLSSFFVRIVKDWNNLPLHVVEAESFNIFKTRLKSFLNL